MVKTIAIITGIIVTIVAAVTAFFKFPKKQYSLTEIKSCR